MGFICKFLRPLFAFLFLVHANFISLATIGEGAECIENERTALLSFKQGILQDDSGMLSTWRDADNEDCCDWEGVHCSHETGHIQLLNLRGSHPINYLRGKIDITSLSELHDMEYLDLSGNIFYPSEIPESMESFTKLRYLNLSDSEFVGTIPYQLGNLSKLRHLDLGRNYLEGVIPFQLGNLSMLQTLHLGSNYNLTLDDKNNDDAKWLSKLSSLSSLDLSYVSDVGYSHLWLQMIGKLSELRVLRLQGCGISYTHNPSLTAFLANHSSSLVILDLSYNNLSSTSFRWPFNLSSNLQELYLSGCDLPTTSINFLFSHCALSSLIVLDLSYNNLTSRIPLNFNSNLQVLNLRNCSILSDNPIFTSFNPNLTSLVKLDLSYNLLTSLSIFHFPLSSLIVLDLSYNNLTSLSPLNFSSNLQVLNLRNCSLLSDNPIFTSFNPNLTSLVKLDLSYNFLTSLSIFHFRLSSLIVLDLSYNNLTTLSPLNLSSNLQVLNLQNCSLLSDNPIFTSFNPNLTSLVTLDLSANLLTSLSIFHWISNFTFNLHEIQLSGNLLEGPIPEGFGNIMNSLEVLNLQINKLQGEIPTSLGNICTLKELYLSYNNFSGELSSFIQNTSRCNSHPLQVLGLSGNQIKCIPTNLSVFSFLESLYFSYNQLKGEIPESIGLLSQLIDLSLDGNNLEGTITESHFKKLSNLKYLSLSGNSLLTVQISSRWIAPFQLQELYVASCMVGPYLPDWLHNQQKLSALDISNCRLSGHIPEWFWLLLEGVAYMNISNNNFVGEIPNLSLKFNEAPQIILTSNSFEGPVPSFFSQASALHLSSNKFSSLDPLLCGQIEDEGFVGILDISDNQLEGHLPNCWSRMKSLGFVDLSNNNLSGVIPTSIGQLVNLEVLVLRNNSFIGELTSSLVNCSKLLLLDVSENELLEAIPSWIGENLGQLQILSLRMNDFYGRIPLHLCRLAGIRLLDLSHNNLTNDIPSCLQNFTILGSRNLTYTSYHVSSFNKTRFLSVDYYFEFYIRLMWKGEDYLFKRPEQLLRSIDLSSNALIGEIPIEVVSLLGLVSLNLSRNKLSGKIPIEIGNLGSLEFLDLSRNRLSGPIPLSLVHIDRLSVLDLSNNRLSGKIPTGTQLQSFNASSYEGNLDLCGLPLDEKCPEDERSTPKDSEHYEDDDSYFTQEFYLGLGLGFAFGFWAFLGPLLYNRSWRQTYYGFVRRVADKVQILVAIYVVRYLTNR